MRKMVVALTLTLALFAAAAVDAGYRVVRLSEVLVLAREGVADRTIISFLENRQLDFAVGTEEILRLRDAGAGEEVIRYLIERTAPRDSYAAAPYPDRSPYDYADSPYDEPGYDGAYIEYSPSYRPVYYVGASIGPYLTYDRYYRGGLGGWLSRTFGFGHRYGRNYSSRYDRGGSYGRHYSYSYRSGSSRGYGGSSRAYGGSSRGYRVSHVRSSSHGSGGARHGGGHAVPRGRGHDGGHRRR
jgi:hypothetical protein